MAHFIIQLPDGRKASVRKGTIIKKGIGLQAFFSRRLQAEKKSGYIIHLGSPDGQQKEYRLLKSTEGSWLTGPVAGFGHAEEDSNCVQIKQAIDEHER